MIGPGFGAAGCGPIGILIGFLLVGLLLYLLLKNRPRHDEPDFTDSSKAVEQLKIRLAQGEITPEEYQKMKDLVSK